MMKRTPLTHARVFSDEDYAEKYAAGHQKMAENIGQKFAKKLLAFGFEKGRILDVGCGFGATNMVLAESFPKSEVVGIDLSEPLLALARERVKEAGMGDRVRFEMGDVQEMPFEDDSFDVVVNANMVHLVEKPVQMLNEIERVLKPGGQVYIMDLRRSLLGLVEGEVKASLTMGEAKRLFGESDMREGRFSWGLLWWWFAG